jgi:hypothetical protein
LELAPSSPDEVFSVALPPLPPLLLLLIHWDNDDILKLFADFGWFNQLRSNQQASSFDSC